MNRAEKTVRLFKEDGLSCSQAIMTVYGKQFGMDPEQAKCLGRSFSGSIASIGWGTCGYVMGGVLVLALARNRADEALARQETKTAVADFIGRVEARFGTIGCRELLGADLSTPEGRKKIKEENLIEKRCMRNGHEIAKILAGLV